MSATTGCRGPRFVFEELEARLLYSADLAQAVGLPCPAPSTGQPPDHSAAAASLSLQHMLAPWRGGHAAGYLTQPEAPADTAASPVRHEVAFVDMSVDGAGDLLDELHR